MMSSTDILHGKILIVDDQKANAFLLEQLLRRAGYVSIASTKNPGEVAKLHLLNHYDLILLDLEMPGMDGFQVMEDLKKIESEGYLPVLVLTAHPAHKVRALQYGAKDFIAKPFELAEVLLRVHNMLEVRLLNKAAKTHGKVLESLAWHDPLTGLANRQLLGERMSMAIGQARRKTSAMAVVHLDLDGFKQINDSLGHRAGDVLLKMVAVRLTALLGKEDTLARLGGDEFMMVLKDTEGAGSAATAALKALSAISLPYEIEGHMVNVTANAGIGIYPIHGEDADTLMKSADLALSEAKKAGNNTFRTAEHTENQVVAHDPQEPAPFIAPSPDSTQKILS